MKHLRAAFHPLAFTYYRHPENLMELVKLACQIFPQRLTVQPFTFGHIEEQFERPHFLPEPVYEGTQ